MRIKTTRKRDPKKPPASLRSGDLPALLIFGNLAHRRVASDLAPSRSTGLFDGRARISSASLSMAISVGMRSSAIASPHGSRFWRARAERTLIGMPLGSSPIWNCKKRSNFASRMGVRAACFISIFILAFDRADRIPNDSSLGPVTEKYSMANRPGSIGKYLSPDRQPPRLAAMNGFKRQTSRILKIN